MRIYTFNSFGYEGSLVTVEVDLRRGIPAVDIIGLADGAVKESRERMRAAIRNSDLEFPSERILISLSPADIKKDGAQFDLPLALGVLAAKENLLIDTEVIVMGELGLSGIVQPVKGVYAGLSTASACGIKYAIVPKDSERACPAGINAVYVSSLKEAYEALKNINFIEETGGWLQPEEHKEPETKVEFTDTNLMSLDKMKNHNGLKFAMAVAAAGRHHLFVKGTPGCQKTMMLQSMPEILPNLYGEETLSVTRIWSLAGLLKPSDGYVKTRPFRIPHQTASIEGMCGGGTTCRPGEVSLAHNGTLFLDEAAEFRSSVLQMLRVPLENKVIALSRGGCTTVFPANFQLVMAANPCPCGNYGSKNKICLCSPKAIEMYWKKFTAPLLARMDIQFNCDAEDTAPDYTVKDLREMIARAYERQFKRQGMNNQYLAPNDVLEFCKLDEDARKLFDTTVLRYSVSPKESYAILKLARTICDMTSAEDEELISKTYIEQAIKLHISDYE